MSTGKYGQRLQGARLKEQARWGRKRKRMQQTSEEAVKRINEELKKLARPLDSDLLMKMMTFVPTVAGAGKEDIVLNLQEVKERAREFRTSVGAGELMNVEFALPFGRKYYNKEGTAVEERGELEGEGIVVNKNQILLQRFNVTMDQPRLPAYDDNNYFPRRKEIQKPQAWMPSDMYNQVVEDNRKLEAEMKLKTEDIPLDPLQTIFNEMGNAVAADLDRRAEEVLSGKVGSGAMSSTLTIDTLRAAYNKIKKGALDGSMINDSKISDDYPIKDGGTFEYPNELQPKLIKKKERPKVKPGDRDLIF